MHFIRLEMSGIKFISILAIISTFTSAYADNNAVGMQNTEQYMNEVTTNAVSVATNNDNLNNGNAAQNINNGTVQNNGTGGDQINPACYGAITKPMSVEAKGFITYDGGRAKENSAGMISSTSDATNKYDVFLVLKYEITADTINYINTLGEELGATVDLKMTPLFREFGYSCPSNNAMLAESNLLPTDGGYLPTNLQYYEGIYNQDTHSIKIDITNILRNKFNHLNPGTGNPNVLANDNTKNLNLLIRPNKHCIYRTHLDQYAPTISIFSRNTKYIPSGNWLPCSNSCKNETSYQCSPIRCVEGWEKCDLNRMFAKRECTDVEVCADAPASVNAVAAKLTLNSTGYIWIGCGLGVIVLIIALLLFKKMGKGQKYVQIDDEDVAGSVYTGGCV